MKFLHTADWHIGKKLNGYDLLEEQEEAFRQLMKIAQEEAVDGIIVAGDLYDRSVPSVEAVRLLNEMLIEMNIKEELPVLAISGNHDSATRLETGGPWFETLNFHLHTRLEQAFQPVEIGQTQFFLLPYFEPFAAREYFKDESLRTIEEAMVKVVAALEERFKPNFKQVLVAHFFVAGSSTTDSETKVTVGGLNNVPLDLLSNFDYVALGHLHYKNAIQAERARYSGSLLKYSLSEEKQKKGVYIVDLSETDVAFSFREIEPLHDVQTIEASFSELMNPAFYQKIKRDNYLAISLTDRGVIPNVMAQLRTVYPRILQLTRAYGREHVQEVTEQTSETLKQKNPADLFQTYFEETTGDQMSPAQIEWLETTLITLENEKE